MKIESIIDIVYILFSIAFFICMYREIKRIEKEKKDK